LKLLHHKKTEKKPTLTLNDAEGGGGSKCPFRQENVCHFLQDHAMYTKILDFIHKHPR
jgi:hypothetical protein